MSEPMTIPVTTTMMPATDFPPLLSVEEGSFIHSVLSEPADTTPRLAYADYLEEQGRDKQARYLRSVRARKFVRLVRERGVYALWPEAFRPMPPPVQRYVPGSGWNSLDNNPPALHSIREPFSDRCKAWVEKIKRGWMLPAWVVNHGYSMKTGYFGVWTWELLNVIGPLLKKMGEEVGGTRVRSTYEMNYNKGKDLRV